MSSKNNNTKGSSARFADSNGKPLKYSQYFKMVCTLIPNICTGRRGNAEFVASTRKGAYKTTQEPKENFSTYDDVIETLRSMGAKKCVPVSKSDRITREVQKLFGQECIALGARDDEDQEFDPGDMENMHTVYTGRSNNVDRGKIYK